jgi:ATP-dependent DNA helicase RecQ
LLFFRKDRQVQQFFLARRYPSADDLRQVCDVIEHAGVPLHATQISERLPSVPRNRVTVALKLLRDGGIARSDRQREWTIKSGKRCERHVLGALAADYEAKAERDHEALERMVFYAQTGFCRWRVLLEYFDEPLPFRDRCGFCDNCLRPPVQPAPLPKSAEIRVPAPPPPAARFRPGDVVRVARYGEGRVAQVAGDEVTVLFPDRCKRSFLADYVQSS